MKSNSSFLWALIGLGGALAAQAQSPVPYHRQPYALHSGYQSNLGTREQAQPLEEIVQAPPGTPWMRVHFGDYNLGANSYLHITSLMDGATQRLDQAALRRWRSASAYFNGDRLRLELYVAPGDRDVFYRIDQITVGEYRSDAQPETQAGGPESQCGSTDDRVPSDDPAVGRLMPVGCTGWIVSNGAILTAGHCISSSTDTLQFNVPDSLADGTPQNPPPEDQYPIESTADIDWTNDGIGNDWAVFETFSNTETGLSPVQAQQAFYRLSKDEYSYTSTVRVTGYGVDTGTRNQTQQTHTGDFLGETTADATHIYLEYLVDTEGGNSGSPVIVDEPYPGWPSLTLGIHTNGGCNPPNTGNLGTSFNNSGLEAAIQDFPGTNVIYVDKDHFDWISEDGSVLRPYGTFDQGVSRAASTSGTPTLSVVKGTYDEIDPTGSSLVIKDPMWIKAPVGTVLIR